MKLSSKLLLGILLAGAFGILEAKIPAVATLEYFYAKDGTVTGRSVNGKMQTYSYDKKGQLTAVTDAMTNRPVEQYVYDPAGNILSKTVNGKTTTYKYDKANQLVSSTCNGKTTKYEYDAAGRLVKEGTKSYTYGYLDKVLSVCENGANIASFTYHMDGQIATASANGKQESFLWDGLALISRNETKYVNEPYVTGGNPILANDKVLFNDILGTTLGIKTDKYESIQRDAFGMTEQNGTEEFFTGKPYIGELGYAFLFRNYRPAQGKWQTQDPLGYPDGWNNFAYCGNMPYSCIDEYGCFWNVVAGALIGGTIGAVAAAITGGSTAEIIGGALGGVVGGAVASMGGGALGAAVGSAISAGVSSFISNFSKGDTASEALSKAGVSAGIGAGLGIIGGGIGNSIIDKLTLIYNNSISETFEALVNAMIAGASTNPQAIADSLVNLVMSKAAADELSTTFILPNADSLAE